MSPRHALLGGAVLAYLAGVALLALITARGEVSGTGDALLLALVGLPPAILLGLLVAWRRPGSPAGPALVALGAAPALTSGLEQWGATYGTAHPFPAAHLSAFLASGVWVFNLAGFVLLCLVFPTGLLPGRFWRAVPLAFLGAAALVIVVIGWDPEGHPILDAAAGLVLLAALASAVAALVVRYRRGDDLTRVQLRWLLLGAGSVPVLLLAGWLAEVAGAPIEIAYVGFLGAIVFVVPATVAIAILRHDRATRMRCLRPSGPSVPS